eukprot:1142018-Pelagomonas_calceolata.AAC.6
MSAAGSQVQGKFAFTITISSVASHTHLSACASDVCLLVVDLPSGEAPPTGAPVPSHLHPCVRRQVVCLTFGVCTSEPEAHPTTQLDFTTYTALRGCTTIGN